MRPRPRILALPVIVAALSLSSCGSSAPAVPSVTRSALTRHPPPGIAPAAPVGPAVGTTQHVAATGTVLVVTVHRVIDPLRGSGARVPAGMTPVGVLISVRNAGPSAYDSSYTSDFSLLYAGGRAMPVFAPAGACQTHVQDFMNELGAGVARTGCIAYVVPSGQPPTAVRVAPDGGTAGHSVSWTVP